MTKRILYIIPELARWGTEKQLVLLAGGLPREQFEVHLCALHQGGPLEADLCQRRIRPKILGQRWRLDPRAYLQLKRHIARLKPDLVHTWQFAANAYGRAAALQAGVRHLVASERRPDPFRTWHQLAVDRWLAQRTDAIVVNSPGVANFFIARGLPAEKFRVVPSGVEHIPASPISRTQLLAELGLPSNAHLLGAVGPLVQQKRIKDLIWATDLIKTIRDDVHLLILGDGPQRWRLQRYSRLVLNTDKVHFLGLRHDVSRLLPHFDLLWSASAYEGLPNAILEGMAAGLPIVASDIPGHRDQVVPGETGFLVKLGDRGTLARYANKLINDRPLAQRLGAAGRQRAHDHFSVGAMIGHYVQLYRELLDA